jgi:Mor family transcriptional regulator
MSRPLKVAEDAAMEFDLVYAPDELAVQWMNRFSEIISIGEREKCAQICEDMGLPEAAKKIRERK